VRALQGGPHSSRAARVSRAVTGEGSDQRDRALARARGGGRRATSAAAWRRGRAGWLSRSRPLARRCRDGIGLVARGACPAHVPRPAACGSSVVPRHSGAPHSPRARAECDGTAGRVRVGGGGARHLSRAVVVVTDRPRDRVWQARPTCRKQRGAALPTQVLRAAGHFRGGGGGLIWLS
jgi:hypothetical protein